MRTKLKRIAPLLVLSLIFFTVIWLNPHEQEFLLEQSPSQPKKINTKQEKFEFLVFGDSGTGSVEQKNLASLMTKESPEVVIHTGDVSQQSGTFEQIEQNFFDVYEGVFEFSRFYPVLGNHDYITNDGQPFIESFELPGNERYYSFWVGNVLFVALDTNKPLDQKPAQMLSWLEVVLEDHAKEAQWVIVYFHHPPYSTGPHSSDRQVQKNILPILEKYDVDIVFSGHEHNYQRTCPILNGECSETGVVYIVTGGGGVGLYPVGEEQWFTHTQKSIHHFVRGEVDSCNLSLQAINLGGEIFDKLQFSKCD